MSYDCMPILCYRPHISASSVLAKAADQGHQGILRGAGCTGIYGAARLPSIETDMWVTMCFGVSVVCNNRTVHLLCAT